MAKDEKKIITPKFRVSFPSVLKPEKGTGEGTDKKAKYSVKMLFDKGTKIDKLYAAVEKAAKDRWGEKAKDLLKKGKISVPFTDGDSKEYDGYENTIAVGASTGFEVNVIDEKGKELKTEKDFYAGCYARASVTTYAGEFAGDTGVVKKYVKFNLFNIQKLEDGEPFKVSSSANEDFGVDPTQEFAEDEDSYSEEEEVPSWMGGS